MFNNGKGRPGGEYSSADELVLPVDTKGNYKLEGNAYGPEKATWSYSAPNKKDLYSNMISGTQRLPNGNTLICQGVQGIFWEVTPEKEVVWKYINPVLGGIPGIGPPPGKGGPDGGGGSVFRATRIAPNYPGLTGRDLKPGKTLEEMQPVMDGKGTHKI